MWYLSLIKLFIITQSKLALISSSLALTRSHLLRLYDSSNRCLWVWKLTRLALMILSTLFGSCCWTLLFLDLRNSLLLSLGAVYAEFVEVERTLAISLVILAACGQAGEAWFSGGAHRAKEGAANDISQLFFWRRSSGLLWWSYCLLSYLLQSGFFGFLCLFEILLELLIIFWYSIKLLLDVTNFPLKYFCLRSGCNCILNQFLLFRLLLVDFLKEICLVWKQQCILEGFGDLLYAIWLFQYLDVHLFLKLCCLELCEVIQLDKAWVEIFQSCYCSRQVSFKLLNPSSLLLVHLPFDC